MRLNTQQIRDPIVDRLGAHLDVLEVFAEIGSTNSYLMEQPAPPPGRFRVAVAEHQTAGRGRMDRRWHSPPNTGLCLSIAYTFAKAPENVACLTLALGIGVAEAFERMGVRGIGLKWPNDLILRDGKLGGILTEVKSRQGRAMTVVAGVGINVDLRQAAGSDAISSRLGYVSDLASCCAVLPSRSEISVTLVEGLFNALADFELHGFGRFHASWQRVDWLRGQRITVETADGLVDGVCEGIEVDGGLILRTADGRRNILCGSVHLRRPTESA